MLDLTGFEVVVERARILFPVRIPVLSSAVNGIVAALWPFTLLFAAGAILVWAASRLARPLLRIFEHASDLGRGGW